MRSRLPLLAMLAPLLVTLACETEARIAGHGSGTLLFIGSAQAVPGPTATPNDGALVTGLRVELRKDGVPFPSAMVRVASTLGTVPLIDRFQIGTYEGEQDGYARTYTFSARLGADFLEDASLTGPEIVAFSAPTAGSTVPFDQPLLVAWSPSGSDEAALQATSFPTTAIPDTGSYALEKEVFEWVPAGRTTMTKIRVRHGNTLELSGAVPGSGVGVSVATDVEFNVVRPL